MARDRINQWAELPYFNPTNVLRQAFRQGFRHTLGDRPNLPADIPRSDRKALIENLDVALFAHALREVMPDRNVCVAELEDQDHDFVLRFGPPETPGYCPLQLKVLVSEEVNSKLLPQSLLESLRKYADSTDLVVAIKIDRPDLDLRSLPIPKLGVAEVWFFGPQTAEQDQWYLYGDCLGAPTWFQFTLPGVRAHSHQVPR